MAPSRAASCMYTDSRVVSHPGTAQPGTCDAAAHAAADADATTPQQRSAPLERASLQRPASGQQDVVWSRCGDQSAGPRSPALAFGREVSQRPETFHAARFGRYPAQPQQQTRWPVTAAEQTLFQPSRMSMWCSHFDVPVHVICGRLLCITFVWHCTYGTAPGSNERSLDLASRLENMRSRGAGRSARGAPGRPDRVFFER